MASAEVDSDEEWDEEEEEEEEEEEAEAARGASDAGRAEVRREQAVYCPDCEMWLNGPTQWEDHKIGKKHKKNKRLAQTRGVAVPCAKAAALPKQAATNVKGGHRWRGGCHQVAAQGQLSQGSEGGGPQEEQPSLGGCNGSVSAGLGRGLHDVPEMPPTPQDPLVAGWASWKWYHAAWQTPRQWVAGAAAYPVYPDQSAAWPEHVPHNEFDDCQWYHAAWQTPRQWVASVRPLMASASVQAAGEMWSVCPLEGCYRPTSRYH